MFLSLQVFIKNNLVILSLMKKIFNRGLCMLLLVVVFFSLTGCAQNFPKQFPRHLDDQSAIYESLKVNPADLSSRSKCSSPPSVKIINIENRTDDYDFLIKVLHKGYIKPREMMDNVSLYLKKGFEKSRITVDEKSAKVLQIKMIYLQTSPGWGARAYFKMELIIPETNFYKFYEDSYHGWFMEQATAYAIHVVTRQIIDDPEVQDYILCR